jgi:predicted transcriptional regulator YdeE
LFCKKMNMFEIRTIAPFTVHGQAVRTNNAAEASAAGKIPALWAAFAATHSSNTKTVYGVYSDYESDAAGDYTLTLGLQAQAANPPCIALAGGTYLVFPAQSAMPNAVLAAWQAVWAHFSPENAAALPYQRCYATDFEEYASADKAAVYIGISLHREA